MIESRPTPPNAWSRIASAASLASPRPRAAAATIHPLAAFAEGRALRMLALSADLAGVRAEATLAPLPLVPLELRQSLLPSPRAEQVGHRLRIREQREVLLEV